MVLITFAVLVPASFGQPPKLAGRTSLTDSRAHSFRIADSHEREITRAGTTMVVVDNQAANTDKLPDHRPGYNGIAKLTHAKQPRNVFVPRYAGLNFEHIHDGTMAVTKEKFEPRRAPMSIRVIDEHTVELYQPATPNWQLESCGRYHLLSDGTIEYTFECIPRADVFKNRFAGFFWASYIHEPQDIAINFQGVENQSSPRWIRSVSPKHGVLSTHPPRNAKMDVPIVDDFPLTLVNHPSNYRYTAPWYFGTVRGMALVYMFRDLDGIWFAQSPTGGGKTNPAWDFQWFLRDYEVGESYGLVMRMMYTPFESREKLTRAVARHLAELNAVEKRGK